jgi:diguanylate cyclase (GGDEF)-like protein
VTVTIGGRTVYQLSRSDGSQATGAVENIVPLPVTAIGQEVVITFSGNGIFRYKAIDAVYIGEEQTFVKDVVKKQIPMMAFAFFCFSIAVVQLATSIFIKSKNSHQMLYLGCAMLLYSLWIFGASRVMDFFSDYRLNGQNMRNFALSMIGYPLFCYISLRFDFKKNLLNRFLRGLTFFNFIVVLILWFLGISLEESAFVTYLILTIVFGRIAFEILKSMSRTRIRNEKEQQYVRMDIVGLVLLIVGFLVDVVRYMFSIGEGWVYYSPLGFMLMNCILSFQSLEGALDMIRLGKRSETVKQLAYVDILTQVFNRTALNEDMEKYEKSKKERKGFGIIVFDVNNLKWVNDNLGHLAGDKLLQDSAAIIRDGFEGYGKTYRYGGDEFVVIMEDGAKEKYSYGIQQMERLLARHNENFKKKEWISIAYGVAYYDGSEEETLWQVHAAADSTMYERKRQMKAKMVDGKDVRRDMRVDPV